LVALIAGWALSRETTRKELGWGRLGLHLWRCWSGPYVVPLAIVVIFLSVR